MPNRAATLTGRETRRVSSVEVRADDGVQGKITVRPLVYNVVDDYQTMFRPGVFTRSIERLALEGTTNKFLWDHDPGDPIGHMIDYTDTATAPVAQYQLDDFGDVPRARQAFAQIRSKTIDGFSVGFVREKWESTDDPDVIAFVECAWDETSCVSFPAVPGTGTVAVRKGSVNKAAVMAIARLLDEGRITLHDALSALTGDAASLAVVMAPSEPDATETDADDAGKEDEPVAALSDEQATEVIAEAEAALAIARRR